MAELHEVKAPDVGGEVEVIEILVSPGDEVAVEQSLLTVESDKATMDIPAPIAGVVAELKVTVGDKIKEGDLLALFNAAAAAPAAAPEPAEEPAPAAESAPAAAAETVSETIDVTVPDIGTDGEVDVIDVVVSVGDEIEAEARLITVETDKATMDVPSPAAGVVESVAVKVGDKVGQGSLVITLTTKAAAPAAAAAAATSAAATETVNKPVPVDEPRKPPVPDHPLDKKQKADGLAYASPAVRRLANEFGVDLLQVKGTGRKQRILKEDVQEYVKYELSRPKATAASGVAQGAGGLQVIAQPKVDFSKFGEIEEVALTRIQKISGPNLHRNWVTIPHVTQFDEADITELEAFRKQENELQAKKKDGVKITPLVFIMKAVAKALREFPVFNSSLSEDGEHLIM